MFVFLQDIQPVGLETADSREQHTKPGDVYLIDVIGAPIITLSALLCSLLGFEQQRRGAAAVRYTMAKSKSGATALSCQPRLFSAAVKA